MQPEHYHTFVYTTSTSATLNSGVRSTAPPLACPPRSTIASACFSSARACETWHLLPSYTEKGTQLYREGHAQLGCCAVDQARRPRRSALVCALQCDKEPQPVFDVPKNGSHIAAPRARRLRKWRDESGELQRAPLGQQLLELTGARWISTCGARGAHTALSLMRAPRAARAD